MATRRGGLMAIPFRYKKVATRLTCQPGAALAGLPAHRATRSMRETSGRVEWSHTLSFPCRSTFPMSDRYLDFATSRLGLRLVGALGLPAPVRLERWQSGRTRPVEGALLIGGGSLASAASACWQR